jgi:hypothetical protein
MSTFEVIAMVFGAEVVAAAFLLPATRAAILSPFRFMGQTRKVVAVTSGDQFKHALHVVEKNADELARAWSKHENVRRLNAMNTAFVSGVAAMCEFTEAQRRVLLETGWRRAMEGVRLAEDDAEDKPKLRIVNEHKR